jgi:hypothetical protein
MIRGFSSLVKKKNRYVPVSLNNIARNNRKPRDTGSTRESPRPNSNRRARIANTLVKIQRKNVPNRVGSILAKEPNWHGDRKLLAALVRTGQKIGQQSVHGVVKRLDFHGVLNRYVVKKVSFRQQKVITQGKEQPKLQWFRTEVRVGQMPHIDAVGPRIHAWRLRPDGAEYVMDNVELGDPAAKTFTFYQIKKRFGNMFNDAVLQTLEMFHKITGGQHGDFHGENILFVQRGRKLDVRIIDYGAWKSDAELLGDPVRNNIFRLANGRLFRKNENMMAYLVT